MLDNYPDHHLSADQRFGSSRNTVFMERWGLVFWRRRPTRTRAWPEIPRHRSKKCSLCARCLLRRSRLPSCWCWTGRRQAMPSLPIAMVHATQAPHRVCSHYGPWIKSESYHFNEAFGKTGSIPVGPASGSCKHKAGIDQPDQRRWRYGYLSTNGRGASQAVLHEDASSRHIILLTDGDPDPRRLSGFSQLEQDAAEKGVGMSTVGEVGNLVNSPLLNEMAHSTNGAKFVLRRRTLEPRKYSTPRCVRWMTWRFRKSRCARYARPSREIHRWY